MQHPGRGFFYALAFTVCLAVLVAAAIAPELGWLGLAFLLASGGAFAFFVLLFPGSRAFSVGLMNGLAVYACLFVYFTEANFHAVADWSRPLGFLLPVIAFLLGATVQRAGIRRIVVAQAPRSTGRPGRLFLWLLPVGIVGLASFAVPGLGLDAGRLTLAFLVAMGAIGVVVALLSLNIAVFLLDSSLLFENLFHRLGRLVTAAFAFLTLYSMLVIAFGAVYRLLSYGAHTPQFAVGGVVRDLSFPEALYFSLVTLATLGYGDVVPVAAAARILVAMQTVIGLLLLLFGFAEIQRALRERGER